MMSDKRVFPENNDAEVNTVETSWRILLPYLPLTLCILWIFIGTVFYAVHDDLGWARGLFMSVNAGWSIGWPMEGLSNFDTSLSKVFTIYHTSAGVLFAGVTVLYIAEEVGKSKDNWIIQIIKVKERDVAAEGEGWWKVLLGHVSVHWPTFRIILVFLMWVSFGLLWYPFTNEEYSVAKNADFIVATLTTGGYMTLPSSVQAYQLIVSALYTTVGVPFFNIALGLLMSLFIEAPEENLIYHQIIAPVSHEEISFMQEFAFENHDGVVDCKEFMILAVARIGSASPERIREISLNFKKFDKLNTGMIYCKDIITSGKRSSAISSAIDHNISSEEEHSDMRHRNEDNSKKYSLFNIFSKNGWIRRAKKVSTHNEDLTNDSVEKNIAKIRQLAKTTTKPVSDIESMSSRRVIMSLMSNKEDDNADNDVQSKSDRSQIDKYGTLAFIDSEDNLEQGYSDNYYDNSDCVGSLGSHIANDTSGYNDLNEKSVQSRSVNTKCSSGNLDQESGRSMPQPYVESGDRHSNGSAESELTNDTNRYFCTDAQSMDIKDNHGGNKHMNKFDQAKRERIALHRQTIKNKRKNQGMMKRLLYLLKSKTVVVIFFWLLWLAVGAIFFTVEEGISICRGIYVSTSIGYGIFWYDLKSKTILTKVFTSYHFGVGVLGVALAMALFARNLVMIKKKWFSEAQQQRAIKAALATDDKWDDIQTLFNYYWPKISVHIFFILWTLVGTVWISQSVNLTMIDALLYCMTTMATGGLVSLPSAGVHEWDYVFVSIYIVIGVPLMAISCGISAHNISLYGKSFKIQSQINSLITDDEIVMLQHLGIVEKFNGYIGECDYMILMLVRIGSLNPDLIEVLRRRFCELDKEGKGALAYSQLQRYNSFGDNPMLMPVSFKESLRKVVKNSTLVHKLRLDSMGGEK